MQALLLILEERLEGLLQLAPKYRHRGNQIDSAFDERLIKSNNHKYLLYMHLDDGLANERGSKERPEWHQKVAARDPSQIEQRIGNLSNGT